ncbi:HAD hydrolase-like protein [Bacillus sp. FJAT-49736]|uniref:HAD hydrolase-like protein n=1 Tax=Bacillus sp. FJAT-49736 TaxID=2833582 RepID=UPI001BC9483A|nr:HAD hydrolase-like protein [Bacillus sp. FJAT-49736]MBS4174404.1 HAD hydrolase-like protein [Bacillus sp. FJAT-49736]
MTYSIIFDMDGTLFQTDKILEISLEETFADLRKKGLWEKETPIKKYRDIMGVPLSVVWETLLPDHSMEVRSKANEFFHDQLIYTIQNGVGDLYPHVEELFTYLKNRNIPIYIASNGLPNYLEAIMKHYSLDNWVKEVFSIQQIESRDKTDLVHLVMKKYKIQRGAVVGDRLSDIKAAKANGLHAIGCRFDFAKEDELSFADTVIDDLMEIRGIIEKEGILI